MKNHNTKSNRLVIFYDGSCSFCNRWAQWIRVRDKLKCFELHPFKSEIAQQFFEHNTSLNQTESITVWDFQDRHWTRSKAVFEILKGLKTRWKFLLVFKFLPSAITDLIYRLIANNRYNICGKVDSCSLN